MTQKRIEAVAVISGKDRTGNLFSAVAQKMGLIDRAARNAERSTVAMSKATLAGSAASRKAVVASERAQRGAGGGGMFAAGGTLRTLAGVGAAYGGAGLIRSSVTGFAELEAKVVSLGITAEATAAQVRDAMEQFRTLAPQYGVPAQMISDAAEKYVAAGVSFRESVAATAPTILAAKASGGEIGDLALAGIASMNSLKIQVTDLSKAFDIMAKAGKLGNFELKDMARELPGVTSRAQALGLTGLDGLTKIVSMLEITRKTSRDGAEAANNLVNIFDKMVSPDTIGNFKKMGVNLEKELKAGLKEGKDFVETTLNLVEKLTKGDPFKVAQLFKDRQAREGLMALVKFRDEYRSTIAEINKSAVGTNLVDLAKRLDTAKGRMDRLGSAWEVLKGRLGEKIVAPILLPGVDAANKFFENYEKYAKAQAAGKTLVGPGQEKFNALMDGVFGATPYKPPKPAGLEEMRRKVAESATARDVLDAEEGARLNLIAGRKGSALAQMFNISGADAPNRARIAAEQNLASMQAMRNRLAVLESAAALPAMTRMPQSAGAGFSGQPGGMAVPPGLTAFGKPGDIRAALEGLKAKVEHPVDVTGKVKLEGQAQVNVRVQVDGPGRVTSMGATGSGHIAPKVSTTMSGQPSQ